VDTFLQQQIYTTEELLEALFSTRSVPYQRRVCGSVCVSPIVASKGSVNTFLQQQRTVAGIVFYAVPAVSKERMQSVLIRTFSSCYSIDLAGKNA
jgi:hypothetical protein